MLAFVFVFCAVFRLNLNIAGLQKCPGKTLRILRE